MIAYPNNKYLYVISHYEWSQEVLIVCQGNFYQKHCKWIKKHRKSYHRLYKQIVKMQEKYDLLLF